MKRALLLVLAASALALADDELTRKPPTGRSPKIEFAEKEFLFEGAMVGSLVTHAFKFKNTGTADLVIRRVDPTCGCTVGKFPHEPIKPGGEGAVELQIDTSEKIGPCMVRATVYSNDGSANAIGPNTSLLEMKGEVATCYKLMPLGAYYGPVLRGRQPVAREIRAPGNLDAENGFEITSIDVPVDWVKVEQRPLDKTELQGGAKAGFALKVSILPHVPLGEFHEWIVVHTNVAKQPFFKFPIVGTATGPIKPSQEHVHFSVVRRGKDPERVIPLERIDNQKGMPILGVDFDATRLDVKNEVVVDGVRNDLRIKLRPDAPPGPFGTFVTVRLDLPEEPLLRIPVYGEVVGRVQPDPALVLASPGTGELHFSVTVEKGKLLAASSESFETKVADGVVTLTPKKALAAGAKLTVDLKTDVPGEESVRVPVEVR
jgi:hypothetical protein